MSSTRITVICATSPREALNEIVPLFEVASGHRVTITYCLGSQMKDRLGSDLAGDVVILPAELAAPLVQEGRVVAGTRTDVVRSGSAVAVRAGAQRPDIGSPEAFRDALLAARTVCYSRGASGLLLLKGLARLGIAESVKEKAVLPEPGELVGAVVARGDAELGIQQLNELMMVPGVDIVGPLPGDLQIHVLYGASMLPGCAQPAAAQDFVTFLRSPQAASVFRKAGMQPV